MPTPYSRIRASATGITNIAVKLAVNGKIPQELRDLATQIVLLSADIPSDIAAVQRLVQCYEADMRALVEESLERERYITQLERRLYAEEPQPAPLPIPLTREPLRAASGE